MPLKSLPQSKISATTTVSNTHAELNVNDSRLVAIQQCLQGVTFAVIATQAGDHRPRPLWYWLASSPTLTHTGI